MSHQSKRSKPEKDKGEDSGDKEKGARNNKTIEGYNIVKETDGWRVVKIIAQTNGRCSFEYLSIPDLRVFAIERLRRIMHHELWRDA